MCCRGSRDCGSVAERRSEKAEQRCLAAPMRSSPLAPSSSMSAASILTPLAISGRLLEMVLTAAPTALWSVSSPWPVRVTICAVAAFMADTCEWMLCLLVVFCVSFQR